MARAWLFALLVGLMWFPQAGATPASLTLGPAVRDVEAWPATTMLADPDGTMSAHDAIAQRSRFTVPQTPRANLGPRRDVVWLHVPLSVAVDDDGHWLAVIDYPALDEVELHLVADGQAPRLLATLGDGQVYAQRPMQVRPHAAALHLRPGQNAALLLRVQTRSAMIVPLRLMKDDVFHAGEVQIQLVQGVLAGLSLCLVLYALAQWAGTRDPMFVYFAATVASVALFQFAYHGLGPQHLWPAHAWLNDNAAVLFILLSSAGAPLLVERMLDLRADSPRLAAGLRWSAVAALVAAGLFVGGVLGYRAASVCGNLIGALALSCAVPLAWRRAWRGDEMARYLLAGWCIYLVGIVLMTGLLRGLADSNVVTQHALQVGALFETLTWLRVMGLRAGDAQRTGHEREVLRRLAHTDALTGLPNRRGLDLSIEQAVGALGPGQGLAVYMLDLDGFKAVNDSLGHAAGDELLAEVGARLRASVRGGDVVARLGGDEFVVLARDVRTEAVAWQVGRKLIDAFAEPFELHGRSCRVGLTVGFALAPEDGRHPAQLLKLADGAMYAGKQAGKGTLRRAIPGGLAAA